MVKLISQTLKKSDAIFTLKKMSKISIYSVKLRAYMMQFFKEFKKFFLSKNQKEQKYTFVDSSYIVYSRWHNVFLPVHQVT